MEEDNNLHPQPLLWTIPQVAAALNLGRTKVYDLINREQLPVIHFGRSVRVSPVSLQKWLVQREQENLPAQASEWPNPPHHALEDSEYTAAIQSLVQALIGDKRDTRQLLTQALKHMGNIAIPELIQALQTTKGDQRRRLITVLKQIGTPEALAAVNVKSYN